jgi:hypothetical protein
MGLEMLRSAGFAIVERKRRRRNSASAPTFLHVTPIHVNIGTERKTQAINILDIYIKTYVLYTLLWPPHPPSQA